MVLSDLFNFWIWSCVLIYGIILWYCGVFTLETAIILLFFVFFNNYLTALVKALTSSYAIFTYPICAGLMFLMFLVINSLNQLFGLGIIIFAISSLITALFFTLKENLYEELNHLAL